MYTYIYFLSDAKFSTTWTSATVLIHSRLVSIYCGCLNFSNSSRTLNYFCQDQPLLVVLIGCWTWRAQMISGWALFLLLALYCSLSTPRIFLEATLSFFLPQICQTFLCFLFLEYMFHCHTKSRVKWLFYILRTFFFCRTYWRTLKDLVYAIILTQISFYCYWYSYKILKYCKYRENNV